MKWTVLWHWDDRGRRPVGGMIDLVERTADGAVRKVKRAMAAEYAEMDRFTVDAVYEGWPA